MLLPAKQRLLLGIRISINTASFEDLRALPKMNRRTARAILEYRSIHGPFQTWEAVKQVKGVGPKSFRRWKPMLTLQ
ncbi:MAG: helix-hairpin-helix domain-containing protein [Myxococcota bacterium]